MRLDRVRCAAYGFAIWVMDTAMRLLLLSNSMREGMGYLEHARQPLTDFLAGHVDRLLFIPYAAVTRSYDDYVALAAPIFASLGIQVEGIHRFADPVAAVREAQGIMIGGGNTWKLRRTLHDNGLLPEIAARVRAGVPYVGWSAGSNVACPTIMTTNDMPIVDPMGLEALNLVPFQINPHYLHGNPPGFKGETREERILEFLTLNPQRTVAGLREGAGFRVEGESIELVGDTQCRVFQHAQTPLELTPGDDCAFLMRAG